MREVDAPASSLEEALEAGPVPDPEGGPDVAPSRPAINPYDASLHASAEGEVVWTAMARKRQEPEDPSDRFALPVTLDVQVRLVARTKDYQLEQKAANGTWERLSSGFEPAGALFGLAFFGLNVLSEDLAKISKLPKLRPAEAARRKREADYLASQCLGGHERSA